MIVQNARCCCLRRMMCCTVALFCQMCLFSCSRVSTYYLLVHASNVPLSVTKEVSLDSEEAKEELAKREASEGAAETDKPKANAKLDAATTSAPTRPSSSSSTTSVAASPAAKPPGLKTALLAGPSGSSAVDKILSLGKQKAPAAPGNELGGEMTDGEFSCCFFLSLISFPLCLSCCHPYFCFFHHRTEQRRRRWFV